MKSQPIFVSLVMLNISYISKKIYLVKHFVQKSGDAKYCNFLNSKLHQEYFFANVTRFSEHSYLLNHLQGAHFLNE